MGVKKYRWHSLFMDFLSANSVFVVQNVKTYRQQITRETCMYKTSNDGASRTIWDVPAFGLLWLKPKYIDFRLDVKIAKIRLG